MGVTFADPDPVVAPTRQLRANSCAGLRRTLYAALGLCPVALGILGVFVAGLPTTVFVLGASFLFRRSSAALDAWLERNRWPSHRCGDSGRPGDAETDQGTRARLAVDGSGLSMDALGGVGVAAQSFAFSLALLGTATILFYVRTASSTS